MRAIQLMEDILTYWKETDAFKKSIETRSEDMSWKFFDGPPFTSGDPHYGHLMQSTVKDMLPRWMTMRGYRVNRVWGRDCHGIPAENFVNKKLGITDKKQVGDHSGAKISLQGYIEECRSMVGDVNDNRKWFVDHVGRWVDMDNAYFTMDNSFMESVINVFSDLYDKNLIYKGFKVLGYSRALGTALSNSEIAEGYLDRQDPAVTVKMTLHDPKMSEEYETTEDGFIEGVLGVVRDNDRYLMYYDIRSDERRFPGGKVEKGEDFESAIKRELKEELGVECVINKTIGVNKVVHSQKQVRLNRFDISITGNPVSQEPAKIGAIARAEKIDYDNDLGYAIRLDVIGEEGTTIESDPATMTKDFSDFMIVANDVLATPGMKDAPVSLLARTTTPWTLPSNMLGAVHKDLDYAYIYDIAEQEYFVIAHALVSKYYKNPEDYVLLYILKGSAFLGLKYTPFFDYIKERFNKDSFVMPKSVGGDKSDQTNDIGHYYNSMFTIVHADFITADAGTGVAHQAPAFGEDDYNMVVDLSLGEVAPKEYIERLKKSAGENLNLNQRRFDPADAKKRLFNPVDDHGEFTSDVPDFQGTNVIESNKAVIKVLKEKNLLVKLETIDHSYPHCPRTKTPLIYRAMESRFVKEKELSSDTVAGAQEINFEPKLVKNRFVTGLASAPDWNISRSRFWGAPLPVWECEKETCENRKVFGSIAEIEQASGMEVKDLHRPYIDEITVPCSCGATMYRIPEVLDCRFESGSMPYGQDNYLKTGADDANISLNFRVQEVRDRIVSGKKTIETRALNPEESNRYFGNVKKGETLEFKNKLTGESLNAYITNVYIWNSWEDIYIDKDAHQKIYGGKKVSKDITLEEFKAGRAFTDEYISKIEKNGMIGFEFEIESQNTQKSPAADFIAEGLDQTRGWFRTLHVLGHAYMGTNIYKNCVCTGMILAEDGKKMSKSLKNYPDPKGLLEQYGADAFRLYMMASPVVRAEPLRFNEKGVEQMLKDFVIPLQNVWNFFKTYAEVDGWKSSRTEVYFMRHAAREKFPTKTGAEGEIGIENKEIPLSKEGKEQLLSDEFREKVIRINPDIIVTTDRVRAIDTAKGAQKILKEYMGKDVEIVEKNNLCDGFEADTCGDIYEDLLKEYAGKRVLLVSHRWRFLHIRNYLLGEDHKHMGEFYAELPPTSVVKLPNTKITNELDQWMMSELSSMQQQLDEYLEAYQIDPATKLLVEFLDSVTNRWLRRSRRRFWAKGMDADKQAAYETLWEVLSIYTKLAAPFAPFVTEWVWQEMGALCAEQTPTPEGTTKRGSVHLEYRPLVSTKWINSDLSDEVAQVRKIIKGAMYLRAKHQIKVKQPLKELKFKI